MVKNTINYIVQATVDFTVICKYILRNVRRQITVYPPFTLCCTQIEIDYINTRRNFGLHLDLSMDNSKNILKAKRFSNCKPSFLVMF